MLHFETKKVYLLSFLIFFLSCFLYSGCGTDPEEGNQPIPEENLRIGWEEYKTGNYAAAMLAFEKYLNEDGLHPSDAYNGLGWVYMGLSQSAGVNQKNLAISLEKFQAAIVQDSANADAWIGKAGLLLIRRGTQDDLLNALKAIDSALQGDSAYLYRHDYDSEADLLALKALCYYYLGELDKAGKEVDSVLAVEKNNSAALALRKLLY